MLPLLADENLHGDIVRGLRRRRPGIDLVRAQDVGLAGAGDPIVLDCAADTGRVVLTHDGATMAVFAYERVNAGLPMPGVFEVPDTLPLGRAIEEILMVAECSFEGEWEGQVWYLPL